MVKILISACLLGDPVRYDGRSVPAMHPAIDHWKSRGCLVPFCPEMAGGLPVPRPPAEITGGTGGLVLKRQARVMTRETDVTDAFILGAHNALALCLEQGITLALLKEKSPSCGSTNIYDGCFANRLIPGQGVTASLLAMNNIRVFSENHIDALFRLAN